MGETERTINVCDLWHVGSLLLDVIPLDPAGALGSYFTVAARHVLRPP